MTDTSVYNARDSRYKSPYGAVAAGTPVHFTLRPRRAEGFSRGVLTARLEQAGNRVLECPMPWTDTDFDRDAFSCTLDTGDYVGLVWYSFRLETLRGRVRELGPYQLTVYDGSDPVPGWFGNGLCYQIFPDRFYRTRIPDPTGTVGGRLVHRDWFEAPLDGPVDLSPQGQERYNRDFFGGTLAGITEKLDYLAGLGVETLYLCPIFASAENHRYSTADYQTVDPMLGDTADFQRLCAQAHARGMRVILDGVFSHTGFTSRYFNGDGAYDTVGAAQSTDSPYSPWYQWIHWPDQYQSWWGIPSLPTLDKNNPDYRAFLFGNHDAIIRRWLRLGADGWRLDVADELPDDFIRGIHNAARETGSDATVLGEVWEDGTTKIAYGVRRKHLLGNHLDGLMNYPFRTALLAFLSGGTGAAFREAMETLREHYPPFAFHNAMNFLGTHDTPRILTLLGVGGDGRDRDRSWRREHRLSGEELERGLALLRLGLLVLFGFPGAPTLYYGDEAGLEGFEDPWNRRTYPWGRENQALLDFCRLLGGLRRKCAALRQGDLVWGSCRGRTLSFRRAYRGQLAAVAVNAGGDPANVTLPWPGGAARDLLTGQRHQPQQGALTLSLDGKSGVLLCQTQD